MDIKRSGHSASRPGPIDYFTGTVRIDAAFSGSGQLSGATVTFEPGARTAWHTHPLGQTLLVVSGLGLVQREGSPIEEIRPGDIVWFAPDEKHWHGASPECAMSHIAGVSGISCVGVHNGLNGDTPWHDGKTRLSRTRFWTNCWPARTPKRHLTAMACSTN